MSSCTPRRYCERWFRLLRSIYRARFISVTNDGRKSNGCIASLPGCAGESTKTQVKMEDASKLIKIPKSECPDIWIRLPRHKWPKSWSSMEDPVVTLERNRYGHPLAGLRWKKANWERSVGKRLGNMSKLGTLICEPRKIFLSVYVDDIKLAGK